MRYYTSWRWQTPATLTLTLDDFTRIGKHVPMLADLKTSGHYQMAELI